MADWLTLYGTHPIRNQLDSHERELLTRELTVTPTSRVYAALADGLPLDVWAALKTASLVASALGAELTLPGPKPMPEPAPAPGALAAARERLRAHSIIAELPE